MDIKSGDEIAVDTDKSMLKNPPSCIFCHSCCNVKGILKYPSKYICLICQKKFKKIFQKKKGFKKLWRNINYARLSNEGV